MQDETSPTKYSDPSTGMMASLVESKYATAHRQKVGLQDAKVGMFVQSHERLVPAHIEAREKRIRDPARSNMARSDSKGLAVLVDGDDRRQEGTSSIAR